MQQNEWHVYRRSKFKKANKFRVNVLINNHISLEHNFQNEVESHNSSIIGYAKLKSLLTHLRKYSRRFYMQNE